MQKFDLRHANMPGSFSVRSATLTDRAAITRLTERARRTHFHLDWWALEDWLSAPKGKAASCLVALVGNKVAGVIVAPAQDCPVAWVRLIAIGDTHNPRAVLDVLLSSALKELHKAGVESLACMAYPDWLARRLPDLGFTSYTDVATYSKKDGLIPDDGSGDMLVRRAEAADLSAVLLNDRAAFESLWWHTLDSLERILQNVAHFIVAEVDGQVVGHAFSDLYREQGHLVRLAVHPHYQGRGLGSRLLAESVTYLISIKARPLTLNTQSDNYTSQSLYSRFGYVPTGETVMVMLRKV